ncbi:MAG: hypothetical protein ACRDTD_18165 [Pseudonocardiaceae bacterium]
MTPRHDLPSTAAFQQALQLLAVQPSPLVLRPGLSADELERLAAAAALAGLAEHVLIDTLFCADRDSLAAASVDPGDLQQLIAERQHHGGGWTTLEDRLEAMHHRLLLTAGSLTALSDQAADHEQTRAELFLAVAANVLATAGELVTAAAEDRADRSMGAETAAINVARTLERLAAHLREYTVR